MGQPCVLLSVPPRVKARTVRPRWHVPPPLEADEHFPTTKRLLEATAEQFAFDSGFEVCGNEAAAATDAESCGLVGRAAEVRVHLAADLDAEVVLVSSAIEDDADTVLGALHCACHFLSRGGKGSLPGRTVSESRILPSRP